jgi:ATPase family associated with various cellular activities (AAA)
MNTFNPNEYPPHGPPPASRPRRRRDVDPNHVSEEELEVAVEAGSRCEVKRLYEGPPKCTCCTNWLDAPPEGVEEIDAQKTRKLHGQFAVIQRKTQHGGRHGQGTWETSTITVQSALIRDLLAKVFLDYPGINMELQQVEFRAPFQPFLHRWSEFVKCEEQLVDGDAKSHMKLLRDIIEPELEVHFKAKEECEKHKVIPFESLWTIFNPSELVYFKVSGVENVMKLSNYAQNWNMGRSWYDLRGQQVDWSGHYFGFTPASRQVYGYRGTKSIFELDAVPLYLHHDQENIKQRLINRGRKFEELKGYHFMAYDGSCQSTGVLGQDINQDVRGRIIVDALAFQHFQHLAPPALVQFKTENASPDSEIIPGMPPPQRMYQPPNFQPPNFQPPNFQPPTFVGPPAVANVNVPPIQQDWSFVNPATGARASKVSVAEVPPLTDDQLLLCIATVRGFALATKKWHSFHVSGITDITWDEEAFSSLVLPNEEKDLLLAFAQSKIQNESTFDDFITNKGKGIIMLLSGPPGVGKTLTAESIAEHSRVPLYTMSAGEIGIIPANVEAHLKDALERCNRWNAIFLLDEADIFLERRDLNSLKRNELVSIFLRLVEYYPGIMFLTTNRIQAIDPAFESRIDVAVTYPSLTKELRKQVWFNFLTRLPGGKCAIDNKDMDVLAKAELNGRQIKSAVKTAQMLAGRRGESVGMGHVRAVLKLREQARFG